MRLSRLSFMLALVGLSVSVASARTGPRNLAIDRTDVGHLQLDGAGVDTWGFDGTGKQNTLQMAGGTTATGSAAALLRHAAEIRRSSLGRSSAAAMEQDSEVAAEAPAPLTVEILRNAEYQWVDWPTSLEPPPGGKAKLTDGRFWTRVAEGLHAYYVELMNPVAFSDLNGDGIDDAVVFLRANGGGGNHEGLYLAALVNEQGQPRHVDSRYLGDARGGPESLEIEDGYIVVQKWAYGLTDALCCASQKETLVFQLAGDTLSFIDSPEPVRARLGNSVLEPDKIRNVEPLYPAEAFQEGLEGVVVLEVVVGTTGLVADVRVRRSAPRFDAAAIAAVKQWQYVPTVLGGTPVPVTFTVVVRFRLR